MRVRVCAHTFGTRQPGPGSRETQHDATPGPSKSGQNGSGQFRSGQLRSGQLRSGQCRSGQGYLHSRIGLWGLDGWMWMVGPREGGRRTEDGGRVDGWTVDVARIEGEDEDVGCGRDVDSRITSPKGGGGRAPGAAANSSSSWSWSWRGAEVGIGVVRVGGIPLPSRQGNRQCGRAGWLSQCRDIS